jgi:hypothetical protein
MSEQKYQPGTMWTDVANRLQYKAFPDGPDAMIRGFADRTDTDALAQVLHNAGEDAAWIAEGLLDTGERTRDGILHQDVWAAKQQVVLDVLARSMDENYPSAVEAMFRAFTEHSSYYTDDLMGEVAGVLDDPERMTMLAAGATIIDGEVVAKVAQRVMDHIDVEDLLADITRTGTEADQGPEWMARNLGYVLGLADAAEVSVDQSKALTSIMGSLVGASGRAAPVLGPAFDLLKSLVEANQEAAKKIENYGENWSREHQHELLAFSLYTQSNGTPPGYEDWAEANADRIPTDAPDQAVALYLQDLGGSPRDSDEYAAWTEIEGLMEQIGETRRIGDVN